MNSTRIRMNRLNFREQPHQLDSTRIIMRHYGNGVYHYVMISNFGTAWVYAYSRLHKHYVSKSNNPGRYRRGRAGKTYASIDTGTIDELNAYGRRKTKHEYLHRCIATVWVRVPRKLARLNIRLQIDHRNGDHFDNRPCNLRWCTASQNKSYSVRARKGLPV